MAAGKLLGAFVAQLHDWSSHSQNGQTALHLFGENDAAKNVIIEETFTEFFENVDKIGYYIKDSQRLLLEATFEHIAASITRDCGGAAMGDFW